jgi:hypothetical protein
MSAIGPLADISARPSHVCFWGNSGHRAGEFLGVDVATVRGYSDGSVPIPRTVAMLLEVLNNYDLEPADAETVIDTPVTLKPK